MKIRRIIVRLTILVAVVAAILGCWLWLSPPGREWRERLAFERELDAPWRTPINFYGKVVDENGNPVSEAEVRFLVSDLSAKGTSRYQTVSDVNGLFSIRGIRGKGMNVTVLKNGYHDFGKGISQSFAYAMGDPIHIPDPKNPVIFQLRKKGEIPKLVRGNFRVNRHKDESPVEFNLLTGRVVPQGQGHIVVEHWEDNKDDREFDWGSRITVPDGGLILVDIDEAFPFEAPLEGYQPFDEIKMRRGGILKMEKAYYLKLRDGNYAHAKIIFYSRSAWSFVIDYHLNPTGSRNLERGGEMIPMGLSTTRDDERK